LSEKSEIASTTSSLSFGKNGLIALPMDIGLYGLLNVIPTASKNGCIFSLKVGAFAPSFGGRTVLPVIINAAPTKTITTHATTTIGCVAQ